MNIFIKSVACVLIALVLGVALAKQNKDFSLLISLFVCSVVLITAVQQLEPVVKFFEQIKSVGQLDSNTIKILFKTVGIVFLGEITTMLCIDSGNAALGKTIQFLASCVILFMSLPLFESLLSLVEEILKLL